MGKTGSGKTEYMKKVLPFVSSRQATIVLDPKGTFPTNGYLINSASELNGLGELGPGHIIVWRPTIDTDIVREVGQILRAAYWRGDTCILIDDVYGIQVNGTFPKELQPVYTLGREKLVTVIANVQRPTWIPLYMVTEADNHVCFRLRHEDDRKRMASMMGPVVMQELNDYKFWYQSDDRGVEPIQPLRIRLDNE